MKKEEKEISVTEVKENELDRISGGAGYAVDEEVVIGGDNTIRNESK